MPNIISVLPKEARLGDTITIKGSNFNNITSVYIAGRAATNYKVIDPATITAIVGDGDTRKNEVRIVTEYAIVSYFDFTLLPKKIDGYDNSLQVAAEREIAYWDFETNLDIGFCDVCKIEYKEVHSGIGPIVDAGIFPGLFQEDFAILGQSLNLSNGYLVYPPIPSLNTPDALSSFTISLWEKELTPSAAMSTIFQLSGSHYSKILGQVQVGTLGGYGPDTTAFTASLTQITPANGTHTENFSDDPRTNNIFFPTPKNKWNHIVVRFDGLSRKLDLFIDGILLDSWSVSAVTATETFTLETPVQPMIGTFAFQEDGFVNSASASSETQARHGITAALDEIRVFNATLSNKEILALTHLGQAGR